MKKVYYYIILIAFLLNSCAALKQENEKGSLSIVEISNSISPEKSKDFKSSKPSINVIPFHYVNDDNVATILSSSAYDNIDLNLRLTGKYQLKELSIEKEKYTFDNIKKVSFENEIDNTIYGNIVENNGIYKIVYSIYNTESDQVSYEDNYTLESILDIFTASDEISSDILKNLSDIPLSFGYINIKSDINDINTYQIFVNDLQVKLSNNPVKVISGNYHLKIIDSEKTIVFNNKIKINSKEEKTIEIIQNNQLNSDVKIGDKVHGGIVFYINKKGGGLVAAPTDYDFSTTWKDAKSLCNNLVLNGFDDWYLPSMKELKYMYNNLKLQNLGNFIDHSYWSSNKKSGNKSWVYGFGYGYKSGSKINSVANVRAIRKIKKF